MRVVRRFFSLALITTSLVCQADMGIQQNQSALVKPSGNYSVGFQDFYWINEKVCPDPFYNIDTAAYFRADNPKHCHEMMVRIYYPTDNKQVGVPYSPQGSVNFYTLSSMLSNDPHISSNEIAAQLTPLMSYSAANPPISQTEAFPLITFSPGLGAPAQIYENILTELASHGYILAAINSSFINLSTLPNGKVIKNIHPKDENQDYQQYVALQKLDLAFVLQKINQTDNSIFSQVDFSREGALGHSDGGRAVSDTVLEHPNWVIAAAVLDAAPFSTGAIQEVKLPFLYEMSAFFKNPNLPPVMVNLGNEGYLVELRPDEQNFDYTQHLNETDLSTLQSLTVFQKYIPDMHQQAQDFILVFMSHTPTPADIKKFTHIYTYVFIKPENQWGLALYSGGESLQFSPNDIQGLQVALANLPNKKPEDLTPDDTANVQKIMSVYNGFLLDSFLGTGQGQDVTKLINTYLLRFFDAYLKGIPDQKLQRCVSLSQNTLLRCGPGTF